jgi:hypothetical protein
MNQTKRLPQGFREFEADGHKFEVNTILSIDRYEHYQKLQPRLAYGIDFQALFNSDKKVYQLLNDQRFADCAVIIHNRMNGIKDILDNKREEPGLLTAALAILRDDEDPAIFDEKFQIEKIANWRKEGYAMEDFFLFAAAIMKGLPKAYNEYIQIVTDVEIKIS